MEQDLVEYLSFRQRAFEMFSDVIDRFEAARKVARFVAARKMNGFRNEAGLSPGIRMTAIDADALEAWRGWGARLDGQGGWDWARLRRKYRKRIDRLEAAIWHDNLLCGLMYGRISKGREVVRTDLLEARPGLHPLKGWVAPIVAELMGVFAYGFGAKALRFHRPVPGAKSRYRDMGFEFFDEKGQKPYSERQFP